MASRLAEAFVAIRADHSKLGQGFAQARKVTDEQSKLLSLGLKRDIDGRLRDISGRFASMGQIAQAQMMGIKAHTTQAGAAMKSLGAATTATTTKGVAGFAKMQGALLAFGKQMMATAGVMGGAFAVIGAVRSFAEYEDAMSDARVNFRLLGEGGAETFALLQQKAREAGATTMFTAGQAASALNMLGLGGLNARQAIGALDGVLTIAAATGMDLATASRVVVNNMNKFGIAAENAASVGNMLVSAQTRAQTTAQELAEAHDAAGSIAGAMNISFQDTTAIFTMMGRAGEFGANAGTALKVAFGKLLNPTKQVNAALDDMGINMSDFTDEAGNIDDPIALFQAFIDANIGVDQAMAIFGARGARMIGLFKKMRDAQKETGESLQDLSDAIAEDNIAVEAAQAKMQTFTGRLKALMSALQELAISVLGPVITGLAEVSVVVTAGVRAFASMNEASGGLAGQMLKVAGTTAVLAVLVPKLAGGIMLVSKAMKVAMLSNPFTTVLMGATVLVAAILNSEKAMGFLGKAWQKVVSIVTETLSPLRSTFEQIRNMASEAWVNIKERVEEITERIKEIWHSLTSAMADAFAQGAQRYGPALLSIAETAAKVVLRILDEFSLLTTNLSLTWDLIKLGGKLAFQKMGAGALSAFGAIVGAGKAMGEYMMATFTELGNVATALGAGISAAWKAAFDPSKGIAEEFSRAFVETLANTDAPEIKGFAHHMSESADEWSAGMRDGMAETRGEMNKVRDQMKQEREAMRAARQAERDADQQATDEEEDVKDKGEKKRKAEMTSKPLEIKAGFVGLTDLSKKVQEAVLKGSDKQRDDQQANDIGDIKKETKETADSIKQIAYEGIRILDGVGLAGS